METVAEIHKLIVLLKDKIQEDSTYAITRTIAAKIEKKAKVLENNTFFVREGYLLTHLTIYLLTHLTIYSLTHLGICPSATARDA
jgi:hypothetical protein